jgi:hypothetical protein
MTSEAVQRTQDAIDPKDERLRQLYAYWCERCAGRSMPARTEIDPLDFRYILGNIVLLGVERDPPPANAVRFRVRLQGTEIVQRLGFDLTGRTLDDLAMPAFRGLIANAVAEVAADGVPLLRQRNMIMDDRLLRYEALVLPLSGERGLVDTVMIGVLINGA